MDERGRRMERRKGGVEGCGKDVRKKKQKNKKKPKMANKATHVSISQGSKIL